jgi:UPF0716 family protein affecting phage T7 exclusion
MKHIGVRTCLVVSVLLSASGASAGQHVPWPTAAELEEQARNGEVASQAWLGVLLVTG